MIVEYDSCHGCGPFRSTFRLFRSPKNKVLWNRIVVKENIASTEG